MEATDPVSARRSGSLASMASTVSVLNVPAAVKTRVRRTYQAARVEWESAKNANVCARIVLNPRFDAVIAFFILANTILVGVEQSCDLQDRYPDEMFVVESMFLAIYSLELFLRFKALGVLVCLQDNWVKIDIFLVVTGIIFNWILAPSVVKGLSASVGNVGVLRTARVFRLARMLRLVIKFRSLWMLMQGLLNSANMMLSVVVVLSIIVYMFACIGVDLVGGHRMLTDPEADEEFVQIAEAHFSDLFTAMLTILSFLVFDSVREIYWPLVLQDPVLMVYFLSVIFTVGIVLANLITAVMVNGAIEQASANREAKLLADQATRKEVLRETMQIFRSMDVDGSGIISREELEEIKDNDAALLQSLIHVRDPSELLEVLDLDDSGEVEMEEFLKVIEQVACHPGESIRFLKLEKVLNQMQTTFSSQCKALKSSISALSQKVDQLSRGGERKTTLLRRCDTSPDVSQALDDHCRYLRRCGASASEVDRALHENTCVSPDPGEFTADGERLSASTPLWAPSVYQNLLEELETSTSALLMAVRKDDFAVLSQETQGLLKELGNSTVKILSALRSDDSAPPSEGEQGNGAAAFLEVYMAKDQAVKADWFRTERAHAAFEMPSRPPVLPLCSPSPPASSSQTFCHSSRG
eukprot:TRINITY_DN22327_c0_g1_i1.p1 TRINITY_DN22327_c0_g1~~TRINITY_DN22327_c0_g1_i1.p1  ORF type:complete len:642 (-),score=102.21 TRINITY_DN22327_c0_g1_i1:149-2074(-)